MLNRNILKISFMLSLVVSSLFAQEEFVDKQNSVVIVQDDAMKLVDKMQMSKSPILQQSIDSDDILKDYLIKAGVTQGFKDNKIVQIATGVFDCENPAYNDDFVYLRLMATIEAKLLAKAKIIESIRTKTSASDQIEMPNNPIYNKFKNQKDKLEDRLKVLQRKMKYLSSNVDEKEIESIEGVTFTDRMNSFMDGVISKVDANYNTENVSREKKEDLIRAKREFKKLQRDYNQLLENAESFNGQLKSEISSIVTKHSDMPLYGAAIVAQSESWKNKKYSVSVAVVWSAKMQRAAEAVLLGKSVRIAKSNPNKPTLYEWLKQQDVSTMTGGRIYTDEKGVMNFIGIAAAPYDDDLSASKIRESRMIANNMAAKEAVMALHSFVTADSETKLIAKVLTGKNNTEKNELVKKAAQKITSMFKDKTIRGNAEILSLKTIHPISQRKIYISMYAIDQEFAKKAIAIEAKNYQAYKKDQEYEIYKNMQKESLKNGTFNTSIEHIGSKNTNTAISHIQVDKTRISKEQGHIGGGLINSEDW
ncbi:hypothetical protein [Sulfurimonas sp.]